MVAVTDYLFLEPLIVERVKASVAGLRGVFTAPDLAAMAEQAQITPAAHVIYVGDETGAGAGDHDAAWHRPVGRTTASPAHLTPAFSHEGHIRKDVALFLVPPSSIFLRRQDRETFCSCGT